MIEIIENAFNLLRDPIIVASAGVLAWQAVKAVRNYRDQLKENKVNRALEWVEKIREEWDLMHETFYALPEGSSDEEKVKFLEDPSKHALRGKLYRVLYVFDQIGFLYNTGSIDKAVIQGTPASIIMQYWDDFGFWIDHIRTQRWNEYAKDGLYRPFQNMVEDLETRKQEIPAPSVGSKIKDN